MIGTAKRPRAPASGFRAFAWGCVCVIAGGCAELPQAPASPPPSFVQPLEAAPALEVGVLIARRHSGVVLPARELGPLGALSPDPEAGYLSFGWGNRRFYMAAHPGSGDAIAALFRSPSVLFVRAASSPADLSAAGVRIRWICADRGELWRLDSYIEQWLIRKGGKAVALGRGPLPYSRFYASTGHYSAVHTCNTWTVAALQYAGLPVKAAGVLFASQVARRVGRLRACPAR